MNRKHIWHITSTQSVHILCAYLTRSQQMADGGRVAVPPIKLTSLTAPPEQVRDSTQRYKP